MKINRAKKVHKRLQFYATNFGFRKPYQVLIDGTLCFAALKGKINLQEQIPKYFDAEVKLLTTQCVILETEKLGPALFGAMLIVKQFPVHKCGHENSPVSGSKCILSMIGRKNPNRYIIASQDKELHERANSIPGVPVFFIHNRTPTLSAPSDISVKKAEKLNKEKFSAESQPGESVKEIKEKILGKEEPEEKRRKRKRPSGPNPLSCKKKKKTQSVTTKSPINETEKNKRKRKRKRVADHVKDHVQTSSVSK